MISKYEVYEYKDKQYKDKTKLIDAIEDEIQKTISNVNFLSHQNSQVPATQLFALSMRIIEHAEDFHTLFETLARAKEMD